MRVTRGRIAICAGACVGFIALLVVLAYLITYQDVTYSQAMTGKTASSAAMEKLRYSLLYGKTVENYPNADDIFRQIADTDERIENVVLMTNDQKITSALIKKYEGREISSIKIEFNEDGLYVGRLGGSIFVALPVTTYEGEQVGIIGLVYVSGVSRDFLETFLKSIATATVLCLVFLVTLSIGAIYWFESGKRKKRRTIVLTIVEAVLLILSTGVFLLSCKDTTYELKYEYLEKDGNTICNMLLYDYNRVVDSGVDMNDVGGIESYISAMVTEYPNFADVIYYDRDGKESARVEQKNIEAYKQYATVSYVGKDSGYFTVKLTDSGYVEYYVKLITVLFIYTGCCVVIEGVFRYIRDRRSKAAEQKAGKG